MQSREVTHFILQWLQGVLAGKPLLKCTTMKEEISKCLDIILRMNEKLEEHRFEIRLQTNGTDAIIDFGEDVLWSSNDDGRKIIPEGDIEELEPFVIRNYNELCESISKLPRL